ncbi:SH3 domain-containing protein [Bacillus sp. 03113]|uniref:SH3 domain-containing protein n=1 Tax=Bacillus sp. 03113 TaxID=2578211 RepID=UPI001143F6F2|nr:SH3 domain-containing protein [Bacillus sp. 03113]
MAKIVSWMLVSLLIIILAQPQHSLAANEVVKIETDQLNVREGPGLTNKVIAQLSKGEKYTLLKEKREWYQIELKNGQKGWVANWHVSKDEKKQDMNSTNFSSAIVNESGLRIRNGPGSSYEVIGTVKKGQTLQVLSIQNSWVQVETSFGIGYASKEYLDLKKNNTNTSNTSSKNGFVTEDSVNIRNEPSKQGKIIGQLGKEAPISILSQSNGWTEILLQGSSGWVNSQYISTQASENPDNPVYDTTSGTITATSLNIRSTPSLDGEIIGSVKKGETVKIATEQNSWSKIEIQPGKFGWISSLFINKNESDQSVSEPSTSKNNKVFIIHNGTNVRKNPNVQAPVVQRVNEGESFTIMNHKEDWIEIRLSNGETGYLADWIVSVQDGSFKENQKGLGNKLRNKTIIIDPGHGGRDTGTIGAKGTLEKELTLKTAMLVYHQLKASGANVILTRNSDTYVPLISRTSASSFYHASTFVSIHYDSIPDRSVNGMTSYYYYPYQKELAAAVHDSIKSQTKLANRGVQFGDFHVLRENRKNAVLVELGYLSNPKEEKLMKSSSFQEKAARGIYEGLANYYKNQ